MKRSSEDETPKDSEEGPRIESPKRQASDGEVSASPGIKLIVKSSAMINIGDTIERDPATLWSQDKAKTVFLIMDENNKQLLIEIGYANPLKYLILDNSYPRQSENCLAFVVRSPGNSMPESTLSLTFRNKATANGFNYAYCQYRKSLCYKNDTPSTPTSCICTTKKSHPEVWKHAEDNNLTGVQSAIVNLQHMLESVKGTAFMGDIIKEIIRYNRILSCRD